MRAPLRFTLLAAATLLFLLGGGAVPSAFAEPPQTPAAVIVLDRGADAEGASAGDGGNVLRIARALMKRGTETRLLALGSDPKGRAVTKDFAVSSEAVEQLAEDEDYAFRGSSDVRAALQHALAAHEGEGPLTVILLGPFVAPAPAEGAQNVLAKVLATWNESAPADSEIVPIGIGDAALRALGEARGLRTSGFLVLGVEEPETLVAPFSPLPRDAPAPEALVARVRLLVDVLRLGAPYVQAGGVQAGGVQAGGEITQVIGLASDADDDRITTKLVAGLHEFTIERRQRDGRTATLRFQPAGGDSVLRYCDLPSPLTFRWDRLKPDVLLMGPAGEVAPTFIAIDVEVDTPRETSFRLRRSRSGPTPAWRTSFEDGARPAGLKITIGDEVRISEEIAECEVRLSFSARPASPLDVKGAVLLQADGLTQTPRLPYQLRVQPGLAALALTSHPHALPRASKDQNARLLIAARNGNVPRKMRVQAESPGGHHAWLQLHVRAPDGSSRTHSLAEPLSLAVGSEHELSFSLLPAAPETLAWPCRLAFRLLPREGVSIEDADAGTAAAIEVRRRAPHLERFGAAPSFEFVDGGLVSRAPILLRLDTDGGDGDWALALMQIAPTVRVEDDAPIGWKAVGKGAGEWEIVPDGSWNGPSPRIFNAAEVNAALIIQWADGAAPLKLDVPIRVAPRWGKKGYILVGLAAAALLLGVMVVFQMRSVSANGTLIYTVSGLEGTVGRLDLAPVGRRSAVISADERGKLLIGKAGTPVVRIHPTRVGGMLEVLDGDSKDQRRLLVDGLSLRAGRHLIRYVSGDPGDTAAPPAPVADLLGDEYDIASGRIQALGDSVSPDEDDTRG